MVNAMSFLDAFGAGQQYRQQQNALQIQQDEMQRMEGMRNTQGKAQAALMGGDTQTARQLAIGSGDAETMQAIQAQISQMGAADREAARERVRGLGSAAYTLAQIPAAQRSQWVMQNGRSLAGLGIDPRQVAQMDLSDQNLAAFIRQAESMEQEFFAPYTLGENETRVTASGQQTIGQAGIDARGLERQSNQIAQQNANTSRMNAETSRFEAGTGRERLMLDRENAGRPGQSDIRALRNEFEDNFALPFEEAQDQYFAMENAAQDQTGASDIALVFSFFKTVDPSSTVREGEFASAANAMGLPARIVQSMERLENGQILTPQARSDLIQAARRSLDQRRATVQAAQQRYTGLAERANMSPLDVVRNPIRQNNGMTQPDAPDLSTMSDEELARIANGG